MTINPTVYLKSLDPEKRKQGIRAVANMGTEKSLRVLVKIYREDPDEAVREMARRGAVYVSKKLKQEPPSDEAVDGDEATEAAEDMPEEPEEEPFELDDYEPVEVSDANIARAKQYIDEALSHQMNDAKPKAIQALGKALQTNPNLRTDNYFQSVASSVMEMEPAAAIATLLSADRRRNVVASQREQALSEEAAEHLATAQKHTWGTLILDIAIFSTIIFAGCLIAVLVIDYTAGIRVSSIEAKLAAGVEDPVEASRLQEQQLVASAVAEAVNPLAGAGLGVGMLLALLPSLIVFGVVLQPVATRMFDGSGTAPYALFKLLGIYNFPMIGFFIAVALAALLVFIVGAPPLAGVVVVGGAFGLVSLLVTIRTWSAVGQAYNFGFVKGFLASLVAGIPANIILSIVLTVLSVLFGAVFAAFASMA